MEELRKIMYKLIEQNGISSSKVLNISIELDKLINDYYKKYYQYKQNGILKNWDSFYIIWILLYN